MIRKYLLPFLAAVGVVIAVVVVLLESRGKRPTLPSFQPPKPPFASFVSGTGTIEPRSGNIAVGTPVPGIVTAIFVKWGDRVQIGDRLFKVDDRDLKAQLLPALAREKERAARLRQAESLLAIAEGVQDKRAISVEELEKRRAAVAVESAALEVARAAVKEIGLEMERRTVRAPVSGHILQIKTRTGEFAPAGAIPVPLMVLGDDTVLCVRVDVDEYDSWRVRPEASAVAFVRGNPDLHATLHFVRIDPYVVAKTSLTGSSTERTDTRILQVVYSFDPARLPHTYVGQQMDVFIEAPVPAAAHGGSP